MGSKWGVWGSVGAARIWGVSGECGAQSVPRGYGEYVESWGAVLRRGMVSMWGVDWHGLVLGAYGEVCGVGVELW